MYTLYSILSKITLKISYFFNWFNVKFYDLNAFFEFKARNIRYIKACIEENITPEPEIKPSQLAKDALKILTTKNEYTQRWNENDRLAKELISDFLESSKRKLQQKMLEHDAALSIDKNSRKD